MKLTVNVILAIWCLVICCNANAASITYGNSIDVDGSLKLINGQLCFPDLTCQSTALINDGSAIWGEITGLIQNQADLQNALNNKASLQNGLVSKTQIPVLTTTIKTPVSVSGITPTWQTQGASWVELTEFITPFNFDPSTSTIFRVTYTDNIGINGSVWCNVGIFLDDQPTPFCSGSWSGSPFHSLFAQQTLTCSPVLFSGGDHVIHVKHRSANCVYGNYAFDQYGTTRQLTVEVYR